MRRDEGSKREAQRTLRRLKYQQRLYLRCGLLVDLSLLYMDAMLTDASSSIELKRW